MNQSTRCSNELQVFCLSFRYRSSSGAYQLQQQPLVYRGDVVVAVLLAVVNLVVVYHRNVVVAVLLAVVGPVVLLLQLMGS
jgi:hypothetical protein